MEKITCLKPPTRLFIDSRCASYSNLHFGCGCSSYPPLMLPVFVSLNVGHPVDPAQWQESQSRPHTPRPELHLPLPATSSRRLQICDPMISHGLLSMERTAPTIQKRVRNFHQKIMILTLPYIKHGGKYTLFLLDIPACSFTQNLGCFGRISWGGPNSCGLKVVPKYSNDPKYLKYPKYPIPNHLNQLDLPRNSRRFDFSCSTFQFLNIQWLD